MFLTFPCRAVFGIVNPMIKSQPTDGEKNRTLNQKLLCCFQLLSGSPAQWRINHTGNIQMFDEPVSKATVFFFVVPFSRSSVVFLNGPTVNLLRHVGKLTSNKLCLKKNLGLQPPPALYRLILID